MVDDLEVHVPQLSHVSAHHLVAVTEDDLAQVEGEQHVQEQDLVGPDQPLLLCLHRHWQHGGQGNVEYAICSKEHAICNEEYAMQYLVEDGFGETQCMAQHRLI